MTKRPVFVTELVDGHGYRSLKNPRSCVHGFIFFAGIIYLFQFIGYSGNENIFKWIFKELPIYTVTVIIAIGFAILFQIDIGRKRVKGVVEIFDDNMRITYPSKTLEFAFDELKDIVIERGSTFHLQYQQPHLPTKVDNFIKFKWNDSIQEYEFEIDSKMKNEMFEQMIESLSNNNVKFKYRSI